MIAVEKQPKNQKKLSTELFDDVPVLQRKWLAAVRPGEGLPRYEEVMLAVSAGLPITCCF